MIVFVIIFEILNDLSRKLINLGEFSDFSQTSFRQNRLVWRVCTRVFLFTSFFFFFFFFLLLSYILCYFFLSFSQPRSSGISIVRIRPARVRGKNRNRIRTSDHGDNACNHVPWRVNLKKDWLNGLQARRETYAVAGRNQFDVRRSHENHYKIQTKIRPEPGPRIFVSTLDLTNQRLITTM